MQSPIKIYPKTTLRLAEPLKLLDIEYVQGANFDARFDPDNPDHGNVILQGPKYPTIKFRGGAFRLWAIHVHTAPEHVIDHQVPPPDFEIHFIHIPACISNEQALLADCPKVVIGVLYDYASNKTLGGFAELSRAFKKQVAADKVSTFQITPSHFFPMFDKGNIDKTNWFNYEGSLTGPPFTENVSWFVMKAVASVTKSELAPFEKHAKHPARTLQPLARRLVVRSFMLDTE
jgi:carbonic anhydrase